MEKVYVHGVSNRGPRSEDSKTLCLAILVETPTCYRRTDRQTDTCHSMYRAIAQRRAVKTLGVLIFFDSHRLTQCRE